MTTRESPKMAVTKSMNHKKTAMRLREMHLLDTLTLRIAVPRMVIRVRVATMRGQQVMVATTATVAIEGLYYYANLYIYI